MVMWLSACSAGDPGWIPGWGRSPGEGNGNPLQYSCLKKPMDGGTWRATVHGVAKSRTRLSDFTFTLNGQTANISWKLNSVSNYCETGLVKQVRVKDDTEGLKNRQHWSTVFKNHVQKFADYQASHQFCF